MTTSTSTTIRIPSALRALTGGESRISVEAATVGDALTSLETRYPDLNGRLRNPDGSLNRFVNLFVGGEDVRLLDGLGTAVAGTELSIVPAVAGGCEG